MKRFVVGVVVVAAVGANCEVTYNLSIDLDTDDKLFTFYIIAL
jgi:hypothetical protein